MTQRRKTYTISSLLLIIQCLLIGGSSFAQNITIYTKKDFGNSLSNKVYAIEYDSVHNILYAASDRSIISFTGDRWNVIYSVKDYSSVQCLKIINDTIFWGTSSGSIGYVARNNSVFDTQIQKDTAIISIENDANYVYFQGSKTTRLYYFTRQTHTIYHIESVKDPFRGLTSNDKGVFIKSGTVLKRCNGQQTCEINSFSPEIIPVKNNNSGVLFTRNNHSFNDSLLTFCGLDSNLWVGTCLKGGSVAFFDSLYLYIYKGNTKLGQYAIPDIRDITVDRYNTIWVATLEGIQKIDINSGIYQWDKYNGLDGNIKASLVARAGLFIGTTRGLFQEIKTENKFDQLFRCSVSGLYEYNDCIYAATSDGLYRIRDN